MTNTINQTPVSNPAPQEKSNPTGPVGFKSGNAQNMTAILTLMAALLQLYQDKNNMFEQQAQVQSKMADDYSDGQKAFGEQELTENALQGAFTAAGGLFTAGVGAYGMYADGSLSPLNEEVMGSQDFLSNLDNDPEVTIQDRGLNARSTLTADEEEGTEMETIVDHSEPEETGEANALDAQKEQDQARLEQMIEEIKSGEYKLNENGKAASLQPEDQGVVDRLDEGQMTQLKEAVQGRIDQAKEALAAKQGELRMSFDKRQMATSAAQGITGGSGQIGAGVMKQQEGEQQANNTQYQTAQEQFQSLTKETEQQADQDLQTAQSLTQLIPELARANNAILNP